MGMMLRRRGLQNGITKSEHLPKRRGVDDIDTGTKDATPKTVKRPAKPKK